MPAPRPDSIGVRIPQMRAPEGDHKINADIRIRTGPEPLDPADAIAYVSRPDAGGTVLFSGTVRSPNEGAVVDHLDYEVWPERVETALETIAREAIDRIGA